MSDSVRLAEPGSNRHDAGRRNQALEHGPGPTQVDQPVLVAGKRIGHIAWLETRDDRLDFGRRGDADQPGTRSERGGTAERGGTTHTTAAGHDQHRAVASLVAVSRSGRQARDPIDQFQRHDAPHSDGPWVPAMSGVFISPSSVNVRLIGWTPNLWRNTTG